MEISNLQLLYRSNRIEAANAYHEVVLPLFRSIRDTCIKLRDLNHETMYAASNRANKISVQAVFSISVIGVVSVVLVVFSVCSCPTSFPAR